MKMYTIDGTEVSVVKKIEEGYLAKLIYSYNGYSEEDEGEIEEICNQVNFYEKLYEKPPTEKYAKEVQDLIAERDALNKEIEELENKKKKLEQIQQDSSNKFINIT
jgi:DNA repair ATPase RecN